MRFVHRRRSPYEPDVRRRRITFSKSVCRRSNGSKSVRFASLGNRDRRFVRDEAATIFHRYSPHSVTFECSEWNSKLEIIFPAKTICYSDEKHSTDSTLKLRLYPPVFTTRRPGLLYVVTRSSGDNNWISAGKKKKKNSEHDTAVPNLYSR